MKSLFLSNQEAEFFSQQDKVVFLRLLKKQPPRTYKYVRINDNIVCYKSENLAEVMQKGSPAWYHIPLRYPSGEYSIKEAWLDLKVCNRYTYKADKYTVIEGNPVECKDLIQYVRIVYPYYNWKWCSPVAMPTEAIRWTVKVETTVKRVQDVSMREICRILGTKYISRLEEYTETKIATECEFIDHWNVTLGHAKPALTKDKTGYEVFPYSLDSWIGDGKDTLCNKVLREMIKSKHYSGAIWKGKPLTIHANPCVEVISVVEKIPRKGAD